MKAVLLHVRTIVYKLADRGFSRYWRRNKAYTEKTLRHLARRYHCTLEITPAGLRVLKGAKTVAQFKAEISDEIHEENEKSNVYAALRLPGGVRIVTRVSPGAVIPSAVARANVAR